MCNLGEWGRVPNYTLWICLWIGLQIRYFYTADYPTWRYVVSTRYNNEFVYIFCLSVLHSVHKVCDQFVQDKRSLSFMCKNVDAVPYMRNLKYMYDSQRRN